MHPILVGRGQVDDLLIGPRVVVTLRLVDLKRYGFAKRGDWPETTPPLAARHSASVQSATGKDTYAGWGLIVVYRAPGLWRCVAEP
jgi:hypothetical protein